VICSFLDPTLWETSIKDNYVYVIVTRGDVVVRRVNNLFKTNKQLEVLSDNNYYDTYKVNVGDIREVWYVRAKISPFLPSPHSIKKYLTEEIQELKAIIKDQTRLINNLNGTIEKILENQG
jgi:hypothetical protein